MSKFMVRLRNARRNRYIHHHCYHSNTTVLVGIAFSQNLPNLIALEKLYARFEKRCSFSKFCVIMAMAQTLRVCVNGLFGSSIISLFRGFVPFCFQIEIADFVAFLPTAKFEFVHWKWEKRTLWRTDKNTLPLTTIICGVMGGGVYRMSECQFLNQCFLLEERDPVANHRVKPIETSHVFLIYDLLLSGQCVLQHVLLFI